MSYCEALKRPFQELSHEVYSTSIAPAIDCGMLGTDLFQGLDETCHSGRPSFWPIYAIPAGCNANCDVRRDSESPQWIEVNTLIKRCELGVGIPKLRPGMECPP